MNNLIGYLSLCLTIIFTVYSQTIIKWQVNSAGSLPVDTWGKIQFVTTLLINPWVITTIIATFLSGISWIIAMSKFDLSYAYPFFSITYVLVMLVGVVFFSEAMTPNKMVGATLIMLGIIVLFKN